MPNKIEVWEHSFPLCNPLSNHKVLHGLYSRIFLTFAFVANRSRIFFSFRTHFLSAFASPHAQKRIGKPEHEKNFIHLQRPNCPDGAACSREKDVHFEDWRSSCIRNWKKNSRYKMECQAKLQIKMVWEDLLVLQANHHFLKPRVIHLMLQLPSQDHLQLFHHPDAHFLRTPCNKGRMCHQLNCREHRMKFAHADVDGVLPVAAVWGHNTARNLMEEGQTSQQAGFIFDYAKHINIYIYLYAHVHIHYIYIHIYIYRYIYIYIHTYTYRYIYTHIYM